MWAPRPQPDHLWWVGFLKEGPQSQPSSTVAYKYAHIHFLFLQYFRQLGKFQRVVSNHMFIRSLNSCKRNNLFLGGEGRGIYNCLFLLFSPHTSLLMIFPLFTFVSIVSFFAHWLLNFPECTVTELKQKTFKWSYSWLGKFNQVYILRESVFVTHQDSAQRKSSSTKLRDSWTQAPHNLTP